MLVLQLHIKHIILFTEAIGHRVLLISTPTELKYQNLQVKNKKGLKQPRDIPPPLLGQLRLEHDP